jgi:hypothetical protein
MPVNRCVGLRLDLIDVKTGALTRTIDINKKIAVEGDYEKMSLKLRDEKVFFTMTESLAGDHPPRGN